MTIAATPMTRYVHVLTSGTVGRQSAVSLLDIPLDHQVAGDDRSEGDHDEAWGRILTYDVRRRLLDCREPERRLRHSACSLISNPPPWTKIAQWTMSGEGRDVGGRFRATDDIGRPTPEPTATASSFLIKGANDDSWQPLDV